MVGWVQQALERGSFMRPLGGDITSNPEYVGLDVGTTAINDVVDNNANYVSFNDSSPSAREMSFNKRKRSLQPVEQSDQKRTRTSTPAPENCTATPACDDPTTAGALPHQLEKEHKRLQSALTDSYTTIKQLEQLKKKRDEHQVQELKQSIRVQDERDRLRAQVMKDHPGWSKADIALMVKSDGEEDGE